MASAARISWLFGLLDCGHSISANVSSNCTSKGVRSCISFVDHGKLGYGSDAAVYHLLGYLHACSANCVIWDRGHRHSDGKSVIKFYLCNGPSAHAKGNNDDARLLVVGRSGQCEQVVLADVCGAASENDGNANKVPHFDDGASWSSSMLDLPDPIHDEASERESIEHGFSWTSSLLELPDRIFECDESFV